MTATAIARAAIGQAAVLSAAISQAAVLSAAIGQAAVRRAAVRDATVLCRAAVFKRRAERVDASLTGRAVVIGAAVGPIGRLLHLCAAAQQQHT